MTNPVYQFIIISIHALREEGDSLGGDVILNQRNFNPRPPRGERRGYAPSGRYCSKFQSTPSARRATMRPCSSSSKPSPFQSTPSARRATHGDAC